MKIYRAEAFVNIFFALIIGLVLLISDHMKYAVFSDLHMGHHNDDPKFNEQCLDFIQWMIEKSHDIDSFIFLGDWFHNRYRLRTDTLNMAERAIRMLLDHAPLTMIVGNHDMFLSNSREYTSVEVFEALGVRVIKEITIEKDIAFVPYLTGTEHLDFMNIETPFVLGHFSFNSFRLNSTGMIMENAPLSIDDVNQGVIQILTGHFHTRQTLYNNNGTEITYIGSPFGHNFSDTNDYKRGFAIWEPGKSLIFKDYHGPCYTRANMSWFIDAPEKLEKLRIDSLTNLELIDDLDEPDEYVNELIDAIREDFEVSSIRLKLTRRDTTDQHEDDEYDPEENLDDMILGFLDRIESKNDEIDKNLLKEIYTNA